MADTLHRQRCHLSMFPRLVYITHLRIYVCTYVYSVDPNTPRVSFLYSLTTYNAFVIRSHTTLSLLSYLCIPLGNNIYTQLPTPNPHTYIRTYAYPFSDTYILSNHLRAYTYTYKIIYSGPHLPRLIPLTRCNLVHTNLHRSATRG